MPLSLWAAALFALLLSQVQAQDARVQRGRSIAQANCSPCHAIGRTGESPVDAAPPFRNLHERYPVEELSEALAEGITTGHPAMPEFQFDPGQIGDFIAYLKSLEQ